MPNKCHYYNVMCTYHEMSPLLIKLTIQIFEKKWGVTKTIAEQQQQKCSNLQSLDKPRSQ